MSGFKVLDVNLFPSSKVVDEDGDLMKVFHGTGVDFEKFDSARTIDGAFHFGTAEQAIMRRSGKGKRIIEAAVNIRKPRRSKDSGGQWASRIKSAKSAGFDGIVYLNRYEGISSETVDLAIERGLDLDSLTDKEFKKFAPEARDSWIAFEVSQIKILDHNCDVSALRKAASEELAELETAPSRKSPRPF